MKSDCEDAKVCIETEKRKAPKLKSNAIATIKGNNTATYDGAIDYAHQVGIKSLRVMPLQFPTEENGQMAVCAAHLETENGSIFQDIGDASPENTPQACIPHLLRMASTRAKNRVLSDAYNIPALVDGATPNHQVIEAQFVVGGQHSLPAIPQGNLISEKQRYVIQQRSSAQGMSTEGLNALVREKTGKALDDLNTREASDIIRALDKQ